LPGGTPLPPFRGPDDEKPPAGERHGLLVPKAEPARAAPEG
jgi:hypothetical protein